MRAKAALILAVLFAVSALAFGQQRKRPPSYEELKFHLGRLIKSQKELLKALKDRDEAIKKYDEAAKIQDQVITKQSKLIKDIEENRDQIYKKYDELIARMKKDSDKSLEKGVAAGYLLYEVSGRWTIQTAAAQTACNVYVDYEHRMISLLNCY